MEKILIVDDDIDIAELESYLLKKEGYETVIKNSGEDALEEIEKTKYDLILMDIMMPVMGGEETMAALTSNPSFNTPVIALTADATTGAKERYLACGFKDYLAKPFSRDIIAKKLDNVLGNTK